MASTTHIGDSSANVMADLPFIDPFESLRNWPSLFLPTTIKMDDDIMVEAELICRICLEQWPADQLLKLRCDCYYCDGCLERTFTRALNDQGSYPPRCHRQTISLNHARRHLPRALVRVYRNKSLELRTKDKTYCSKVACNAFIAPHSIHHGQAHCQKCQSITCNRCKEGEHFGPCANEGLMVLHGLAKDKRWQTCPERRNIVEKIDGCNHVLCRCGCDFCYKCGGLLEKCICDDDDDEDEEEEYATEVAIRNTAAHYRRARSRSPPRESEDEIIEDTFNLFAGILRDDEYDMH